jgi:hypothetical protein
MQGHHACDVHTQESQLKLTIPAVPWYQTEFSGRDVRQLQVRRDIGEQQITQT